eukprot:1159051-Pelagomonas_calceolata.AAC.3
MMQNVRPQKIYFREDYTHSHTPSTLTSVLRKGHACATPPASWRSGSPADYITHVHQDIKHS